MECQNYEKKLMIASPRCIPWALLCFMIVILGLGCSPADRKNAVDKYKEGLSLYQQGRYQEAVEAYKEAIRIKPEDSLAHNDLGASYAALGRYQEAVDCYKRSISIKPDYAGAYFNLGMAYGELDRWEEAAEAYKESVHLNPKDVDAQNNLEVAYLAINDKNSVKKNDAVEQSGYSFEVLNIKDPADRATYFYPKEGGRLVAVEIMIGNISGDKIDINPLNVILVDTRGFLYTPLLGVSGQLDAAVDYLRLGEKVRGWIGFEIPQGAMPQSIKYKVDYGGKMLEAGLSATRPDSKATSIKTADSVAEAQNVRQRIYKVEGISVDNGKVNIFVSKHGKVDRIKIGDKLCEGEVIQIYAPGEDDGITSPQSIDKYEYRIKVRFPQEEKIFKNGDVICGDATAIQWQKEDAKGNDASDEPRTAPVAEIKTSDQNAPGMNNVRNAEESFKNAQEAEQKGLYRKAVFFYEQAVQYAQWALAYIIENKRAAMKQIIREGEQKKRNLAGKQEVVSAATLDALPKFKNAREIMKWVKSNIKYKSDLKLHGERNYWQTPEETVALHAGDCEDYAFLVQALLKRINIESFVISVHGEGISKLLGHALCVFPKNSPTNYFDNQVLYTSGTHVVNLISSAYPLWQRMYVLDLDSRTKKQIMQRSGPSISKVDEAKNGGLLKTFLGEWHSKF